MDPVVYARAVVLVAARTTVHCLGLQDLVCRPPLPATSTVVVVVVVVVVVAVAVAVRVVVAFWAVVFYLTCLDATAVEFVATVAATVVVCVVVTPAGPFGVVDAGGAALEAMLHTTQGAQHNLQCRVSF